jgi:hypothetical protein
MGTRARAVVRPSRRAADRPRTRRASRTMSRRGVRVDGPRGPRGRCRRCRRGSRGSGSPRCARRRRSAAGSRGACSAARPRERRAVRVAVDAGLAQPERTTRASHAVTSWARARVGGGEAVADHVLGDPQLGRGELRRGPHGDALGSNARRYGSRGRRGDRRAGGRRLSRCHAHF